MQKDIGQKIVRGILQDSSLAYRNSDYIGKEIFPVLQVGLNQSKIPLYNRGDTFRDEAIVRARGTETPYHEKGFTYVSIDTNQYAGKGRVTKEDLDDVATGGSAAPRMDLRMDAIEDAADQVDLKIERTIASVVTGATWADGVAGGEDAAGGWTATSSNTMIADVFNGIDSMRKQGVPLQDIRLAMDYTTWVGVKQNAGLEDFIKYSKPMSGPVNANEVAAFFDIDKVVVAGSIYSTAKESAAGTDFTAANIWGGTNDKGYAILYSYPKVMKKKMITAGVCAVRPTDGQIRATYEWYNKDKFAWMYETHEDMGAIQMMAGAAYAWKDTHTT